MIELLTGNEAIARGAYESGVVVAAGYPGTPSTEILESITRYDEIRAEWSPNEKVALEVALGASIAGVRSLAAMKHVGVNVAADPLLTSAYTGVTGGLVLVSADDPGMHSSQNEQDNRNYARFAKIPMLEPSNSQEAKGFVELALSISEEYDVPVLLRVTTRISHSKSLVKLGERKRPEPRSYKRQIPKYVATPANARVLRLSLEKRLRRLQSLSNEIGVNRAEFPRGSEHAETGVIASGVAYQYAREACGDSIAYLKLGLTHPLPIETIREFADKVDRLYVIEELDPYMQEQILAAGIDCLGKEIFPRIGELTPEKVSLALEGKTSNRVQCVAQAPLHQDSGGGSRSPGADRIVPRPPMLCAGCPHRGVFYALSKRKNLMVTGDIGCYTLGSSEPLAAMDTCICMGASISTGHGASLAFDAICSGMRVVAVIGDSTFFHSGLTGIVDTVYNKGSCVTIVLDNRTTGMTGHQDNPGTGYTLKGKTTRILDIATICRALGVDEVIEVSPYSLSEIDEALDRSLSLDRPSVIVVKSPCVLTKKRPDGQQRAGTPRAFFRVDMDRCRSCRLCLSLGCPALSFNRFAHVNADLCAACGLCASVCPFDAIERVAGDE